MGTAHRRGHLTLCRGCQCLGVLGHQGPERHGTGGWPMGDDLPMAWCLWRQGSGCGQGSGQAVHALSPGQGPELHRQGLGLACVTQTSVAWSVYTGLACRLLSPTRHQAKAQMPLPRTQPSRTKPLVQSLVQVIFWPVLVIEIA